MRIEALNKSHDRLSFQSGNEPLDRFLHLQAGQEQRRHVAAVFVACPADSMSVIGYYTLSACSIVLSDLPDDLAKRLPRYPQIPATLLGRLALDQKYQSKGLGRVLLFDALERVWRTNASVASTAVIVDAIDGAAHRFYEHHGFLPLPAHENRLYLPMKVVGNLLAE